MYAAVYCRCAIRNERSDGGIQSSIYNALNVAAETKWLRQNTDHTCRRSIIPLQRKADAAKVRKCLRCSNEDLPTPYRQQQAVAYVKSPAEVEYTGQATTLKATVRFIFVEKPFNQLFNSTSRFRHPSINHY